MRWLWAIIVGFCTIAGGVWFTTGKNFPELVTLFLERNNSIEPDSIPISKPNNDLKHYNHSGYYIGIITNADKSSGGTIKVFLEDTSQNSPIVIGYCQIRKPMFEKTFKIEGIKDGGIIKLTVYDPMAFEDDQDDSYKTYSDMTIRMTNYNRTLRGIWFSFNTHQHGNIYLFGTNG
ncbi:hypothetical protein [uncultured Flavobacterium sp.]|uniref:hypothetical protein n=1 Tax=uncultured Flavobacterium sp. TaxID=165435 RepID=UPI0025973261|nr:hypothetical protein [uncultured Flavobacterium sp.]